MALALVSLGSNEGDRAAQLHAALARLGALSNSTVLGESGFHSFAPVGGALGQGEFLNAAAFMETMLAPAELLAELHHIETELARVRHERWGPRTIDLDLLLYDELILHTPDLTIPHPRMAFRRFVLAPAVEIAPEMRHPEIGWTVRQLWDHLNSAPNYVALHGGPEKFRRALVETVAREAPARIVTSPQQIPSVDSSALISDFSEAPLQSQSIPPKLLVRLDDSPLPAPFEGPLLRLAENDLRLATNEIVAAIHAMS